MHTCLLGINIKDLGLNMKHTKLLAINLLLTLTTTSSFASNIDSEGMENQKMTGHFVTQPSAEDTLIPRIFIRSEDGGIYSVFPDDKLDLELIDNISTEAPNTENKTIKNIIIKENRNKRRQLRINLMNEYDIRFLNDLEGKETYFVPTSRTSNLKGFDEFQGAHQVAKIFFSSSPTQHETYHRKSSSELEDIYEASPEISMTDEEEALEKRITKLLSQHMKKQKMQKLNLHKRNNSSKNRNTAQGLQDKLKKLRRKKREQN